jgi:hypothetical protein
VQLSACGLIDGSIWVFSVTTVGPPLRSIATALNAARLIVNNLHDEIRLSAIIFEVLSNGSSHTIPLFE